MTVKEAAKMLRGVAEPSRLRILRVLLQKDSHCGEISRRLDAPYARIHRHLRYLEKAGLIMSRDRHDLEVHYTLRPAPNRFHRALRTFLAAESPVLSRH